MEPKNVLARVHGMVLTALEEVAAEVVGRMPAHPTKVDLELGMARKSDGTLLTTQGLQANDMADVLAKRGVEHHRVPKEEVERWSALKDQKRGQNGLV